MERAICVALDRHSHRRLWLAMLSLVLPLVAMLALSSAAFAYEEGYVVAHSQHGNGRISGAVRPTRYNYEVRLPGGTWVDCRRSCAETLRVQTIDIFERQDQLGGYGTMYNECGILFGCRNLLRGIR